MPERRAELAAALRRVRAGIAEAAEAAGRDPDDVRLIAVTKTWPASDVGLLAELGVTEVGENRHQEAVAKKAAVPPGPALRWHLVGALQTNKARAVTAWADVVHSLDRVPLVDALAGARPGLPVLVQVSLDGDPARAGCPVSEAVPLAARAAASGLDVRGVMAVAPLAADPAEAFAALARTSLAVREVLPAARWISAGMSADWQAAVAHGATHVRLGSVLLGHRVTRGV